MTKLTRAKAASPPALAGMSIADLRTELARAVKVTADHLAHLAAVWRELEARGEDMSALKAGLWTYMPAIASGALVPELVVKYAGYTTLLGRLAKLPLADQERLLADDSLAVVSFEAGQWVETRKRVTELRAAELSQVLRDRIVQPEDQRPRALAAAESSRSMPAGPGTLRDRAVRTAQRERKLRLGATLPTSLPMTAGERDQLQAVAKEAGIPVARLIRAALVNAGLLD